MKTIGFFFLGMTVVFVAAVILVAVLAGGVAIVGGAAVEIAHRLCEMIVLAVFLWLAIFAAIVLMTLFVRFACFFGSEGLVFAFAYLFLLADVFKALCRFFS